MCTGNGFCIMSNYTYQRCILLQLDSTMPIVYIVDRNVYCGG